jgi:hypothetical protein
MNLLRISFLLFFIIPTVIVANDDYLSVNYFDVDSYEIEYEESEFSEIFKSDKDKKNFKKLREFLNEKNDLEKTISREMEDFRYYKLVSGIGDYDRIISKLDKEINKDITGSIELKINDYEKYFDESYDDLYYDDVSDEDEIIRLPRSVITERINLLKRGVAKCKKIENDLSVNLKNVKSDIYKCRNQIDSALRPEYEQQVFRMVISAFFSLLILFLLAAFFIVVYKKSTDKLSEKLLGENGLKFITLFVLIIAIILFGILGILEGRELSAIISGISGYILGKGIMPSNTTNTPTPLNSNIPPTAVPSNTASTPIPSNPNILSTSISPTKDVPPPTT